MKRNEFNEFVKQKCEELLRRLEIKGNEYSPASNCFNNFNSGHLIATSKSPEAFAWDLRAKHLQSIKDILNNQVSYPNKDTINEKCGDDILYGFIIWAMLENKV